MTDVPRAERGRGANYLNHWIINQLIIWVMKKLTNLFGTDELVLLNNVATAEFETDFPDKRKDVILPIIFADVLHIAYELKKDENFTFVYNYISDICKSLGNDVIPGHFEAMTIKFLYDNEELSVREAVSKALGYIVDNYDFEKSGKKETNQ